MGVNTASLTFTGSKTLDETQGWSKVGAAGRDAGSLNLRILGHLTDNQTEVWPTGRTQCIYPLLRDEQGRKIGPVSKSSLAALSGKQDNIM